MDESFAFELLDEHHNSITELHPSVGAEIQCATGAPVGRTIPTLMIHPDEVDLIDPWTHRIRAWMNRDGIDYALGIFLITSWTPHLTDMGTWLELQLHDQAFLLTENLLEAFGAQAGTLAIDALNDLLDQAGVVDPVVSSSTVALGTHLAWQPAIQIAVPAESLAKRCGFTPPWFDRTGVPRVNPYPYVGLNPPAAEFQPGTDSTVTVDGIQETHDLWSIPTHWRVQSSGQVVDFSATYELPDDHPLSQEVTGRRKRVRAVEVPGLTSDADAYARARDEAQREARVHRTRTFSAAKDPALDQYDIITVEDSDMLLASWTLPLTAGAPMTVTARESIEVN